MFCLHLRQSLVSKNFSIYLNGQTNVRAKTILVFKQYIVNVFIAYSIKVINKSLVKAWA